MIADEPEICVHGSNTLRSAVQAWSRRAVRCNVRFKTSSLEEIDPISALVSTDLPTRAENIAVPEEGEISVGLPSNLKAAL